jgi:tRNA(Ile)-lysidine synthase
MKAVRQLAAPEPSKIGMRLARPLLRWAKRTDTEAFCSDLSIDFRRDEMNDDPAFSRVRVRKALIPMLEEFNPKVIDTLCSTAQRISETIIPIDHGEIPETLAVSELAILPDAEMLRIIRSWLAARRGTLRRIEAKHIEAVQRLVLGRKSGKTVELPGRQAVSKQGGRLVFEAIVVEK